jgi:parallel beta-helix repeat protein
MTTRSWIRRLFERKPRTIRKAPARYGPRLEALEGRLAPATLTVNSTQDDSTTVLTTQLTLRDAITLVNHAGDLSSVGQTQMPAGWKISGPFGTNDTIEFDSSLTSGGPATITLNSALPALAANVTLQGPGANLLAVSGNKSVGVFAVNSGVTASLSGLTIEQGNASFGGGIYNNGGTLTLSNCTLADNSGSSAGGIGNFAGGTAMLSNCTLADNSAYFGGGISNFSGTLAVLFCTISGNSASGSGAHGGGIWNSSTLTLTNCTLSDNSAKGNFSRGGGIFNNGTVTLTNCTLSGNSASQSGGIDNFGTLAVLFCTISDNSVSGSNGQGGGIANFDTLTLRDTIDAGNSAFSGATDPDYAGAVSSSVTIGTATYSEGYNLIGDGTGSSGFSGTNHDQVGTSGSPLQPQLAGLDYYGGPTQTLALESNSPALATGDPGDLAAVAQAEGVSTANATDQRGLPRSVNGAIDLGAFEDQIVVTPPAGTQSPPWGVATQLNLGSFTDSDPNDTSWSVQVNWGDKSGNNAFTTHTQGTLGSLTHTYAAAGLYTVTVTVSGGDGNANQTTWVVTAPTSGVIPLVSQGDIYHLHSAANTSQNQAFLIGLYHVVLNRDPAATEVTAWLNAMNAGASRDSVVQGFWNSPEHRLLEVGSYYQRFLHRSAAPAEEAGWVGLLLSGVPEAVVVQGFLNSPEYQALYSSTTDYVASLYVNLLGRTADPAGLAGWTSALNTGALTRAQVASGFLSSYESYRLAVDNDYTIFYHRQPDALGEAGWISQLSTGAQTYGSVAEAFLSLPEFYNNAQVP